MRRWIVVLATVIALVIIAFVPVIQSSKLSINAPYFSVYQSLSVAKNWAKWYPGLSSNNSRIISEKANGFKIAGQGLDITFFKTGLNGFTTEIKQTNGVTTFNGAIISTPAMKKVDVIVERKVALVKYLWLFIAGDDISETPFREFKLYLEDSRLYYGFIINKRLTGNKLLIVKRSKVLTNNVCSNNRFTLNQLTTFAATNKLYKTAPVQLQYLSSGHDSTEVMIGIPVSKKIANPVQYMEMPGGRVVIGSFKGKYKDRQQLYTAMRLYVADHYLHPQTMPFEVFKYDQLPDNDESEVDMQVVIPYV